jgi:hypothetical protein
MTLDVLYWEPDHKKCWINLRNTITGVYYYRHVTTKSTHSF